MQLTSNETMFLNMIKPVCIMQSVQEKIAPSVMAALAITISDWGTTKDFLLTRNVYMIPVDRDWYGKCYSKDTGKIYNSVENCPEIGSSLYRVYSTHQDSINDFISILMSSRRSKNGPLRYESLVRCVDYKESVYRLIRAGFMTTYLNRREDPWYAGYLQTIIEKYGLYEWDEELKKSIEEEKTKMAKRRHIRANNRPLNMETSIEETPVNDEVNEEVIEEVKEAPIVNEHMYRVRLDWERPDTQIFASPNYADCKEEALKHEGYKIYVDDEGELFEDPWEGFYDKPEEETPSDPDIRNVIHPIPGKIVTLNYTPVFKKAIDKESFCYLTGNFYFYDNSIVHNRAKITNVKNDKNPSDPSLIIGYINI